MPGGCWQGAKGEGACRSTSALTADVTLPCPEVKQGHTASSAHLTQLLADTNQAPPCRPGPVLLFVNIGSSNLGEEHQAGPPWGCLCGGTYLAPPQKSVPGAMLMSKCLVLCQIDLGSHCQANK